MGRSKKMIILLVVLAIIVAAYFGITKWSASQSESEDGEQLTTVAEVASDDITSMKWTFMGGEYQVEKSDGTWIVPSDKDFKVNQNLADYMASIISKIEVKQIISDVTDLQQYGLENSTQIITAGVAEGTAHELVVGSQIELTGDYYAKLEGKSDVYVIDLVYPYNFSCTTAEMKELSDEELEQLAQGLENGAV